MEFVWPSLLLIALLLAWLLNFVSLPGNWLMILLAVGYLFLLREETIGPQIGWISIAISIGLAFLGELWEFFASAAGAQKRGGSKKGAAMAIVGSIVGSVIGATMGVPIPIIGPLIGAVGGGALGAFIGAYAGEGHRTTEERMEIGKGAFLGKLWGVLGKVAIGFVMLIVLGADAFVDLP